MFGLASGNIEVEGKQNSLFPVGSVIKCFVIPQLQSETVFRLKGTTKIFVRQSLQNKKWPSSALSEERERSFHISIWN